MSKCKRYYWLKLQEDFFTSKRIKKLRSIAGGDTYTIIYLKMQLKSLQNGGILKYIGLESSFSDELALDIDEDPDNVAVTLQFLQSCGLIETSDNIEFMLPYAVDNSGSVGDSAKRVRAFRERQKLLHGNADVTKCNADVTACNIKKENEKENEKVTKEKEKELEKEEEKEKTRKEKEKAVQEAFNRFWEAYPRKTGKREAQRKFAKALEQTDEETILAAVKRQCESQQWLKDGGQFIPYPATWLNQARWEDEEGISSSPPTRSYEYEEGESF